MEAWRDWQATTCSLHTLNQRADVIVRLTLFVAKRRGVEAIDPRACTPEEIAAYLNRRQLGSANSRATYYRALASWFGWLRESGRIPVNPLLSMRSPRPPDDDPDPLTDEEVDAVFAGVTGRMLALMSLGLYAGLRVHEAVSFRGDFIRGDNVRICGKGNRTLVVPLSSEIAQIATCMPSGWWFPSPLRHRDHLRSEYATTLTSEHFRDRGVDRGSFHRLRHTYGTRLQEAVGDTRIVQQLMRHKSITSTQRYTRVSDARLRAAIRMLPPLSA